MQRRTPSSAARRRGDDVADWIEKFCVHVKGDLAGKPLRLEVWQRDWIREVFGPVGRDGRRKIRTALLGVARKNGKDCAVDTPILTAAGWKTLGTVQVGDFVYAVDGTLTPVVAASEVFTDHACYRVTFADGQEFVAGEDHEWVVFDRWGPGGRDLEAADRRYIRGCWKTLTTADLAASFDITNPTKTSIVDGKSYQASEFRYGVRTDRVLESAPADLPVDPYVFGYWLGDGTSESGAFTVHEDDWPSLRVQLRQLGVLGNKHVPDQYLLGSPEQRLALLQGLMDSDGSASGGRRRVEFCSTKRPLADAVLFLARTLGWKPTLATSDAVLAGRKVGLRHRVHWSVVGDLKPFRLPRKAQKLPGPSSRRTRSTTNKIVGVEPCPTVPTRCIEIAHPSRQYLLGEGLTPTHNSSLSAALALYGLFADGEAGSEVYAVAGDRDQARNVFDVARGMVEASPSLSRFAKVARNWIEVPSTASLFRVLSADGRRQHGLNPHVVVFDELHVQPDARLWEAVTSGMGARSQPLTIAITTAGSDRQSICYELYDYGRKIESRQIDDPSWHFRWYGLDDGDDWTDPDVWSKANPNLGVSVRPDFLDSEFRQAQQQPSRQNTFRRLYCNEWTNTDVRWLDLGLWDENAGLSIREDELVGRPCFGGLDLAATRDFTALVWVFPDSETGLHTVLPRFWLPRAAVEARASMRPTLEQWERDGWLTVTDGDVVDYAAIIARIEQDAARFDVREIAHDPWNAEILRQRVDEIGLTIWPLRQTIPALTGPSKELERLLGDRLIRHGGNPVLRWQADNVTVTSDNSGNIKPDRKRSTEKIDGIVALVNALAAVIREREAPAVDIAAQIF